MSSYNFIYAYVFRKRRLEYSVNTFIMYVQYNIKFSFTQRVQKYIIIIVFEVKLLYAHESKI